MNRSIQCLFLALFLFLSLNFPSSLSVALAQDLIGDLPRKENVGLPEGLPVEQILKADQEIMAQTQAQQKGGVGLLVILMISGTVLTLAGLGSWYFLKRKGRVQIKGLGKGEEGPSPNDQKRKEDLEELQIALSAYFKLEGRYPSESEFSKLRERMEKPIQDPKEDQLVPGKEGVSFGYFYDQRRGGGKGIDPQYYRLWCFLENGERFVVTSEDQKETVVEGGEGIEDKEEMKTRESVPTAPPATQVPVYYAPSAPALMPSGWSSLIVPFILIMITLINLGLILINLLLVYQAGQIRSEILKIQQEVRLGK